MKNLPLLLATIAGMIALVVIIAVVFSRSSSAPAQTADPALVMGEARLAKGSAEAPVTIVEFADFQCPACRAFLPLMDQVVEQYPDQVRVVYRHFPLLSIHPNAQLAAQAAEAAHTEGQFWEMHDLLFERQMEWENLSQSDAREKFATYAEELSIDRAIFLERIESDEIKQHVLNDTAVGGQLGVNSTPTIYVNGAKITLTAPQQLFTAVAEALNTNN